MEKVLKLAGLVLGILISVQNIASSVNELKRMGV